MEIIIKVKFNKEMRKAKAYYFNFNLTLYLKDIFQIINRMGKEFLKAINKNFKERMLMAKNHMALILGDLKKIIFILEDLKINYFKDKEY
jgi:hypothetical protein